MRFIDFFAGIGGIRLGLEQAGHECVGFCEWDKYARQSYKAMYDTEGRWENHDIRTANAMELPKAELWCFGFPCQDISVAGKQKGLIEGERSNLFFQIIRLLREVPKENKPKWLLAENVKNLLSVGRGWDFARCIVALGEVGYDVEWQLLNTKHTYITGDVDGRTNGELSIVRGVPQNRERIFIVGRLIGNESGRQVFPIPRADEQNTNELQQKLNNIIQIGKARNAKRDNPQTYRVYDQSGVAPTLGTMAGGNLQPFIVDDLYPGRNARFYEGFCPTLRTNSGMIKVVGNYSPSGHNATRVVNPEGIAPTVMENHGQVTAVTVMSIEKHEPYDNVIVQTVLTPEREEKRQNGRRMKENGEPMFTLTAQDRHGVAITVNECSNNNT